MKIPQPILKRIKEIIIGACSAGILAFGTYVVTQILGDLGLEPPDSPPEPPIVNDCNQSNSSGSQIIGDGSNGNVQVSGNCNTVNQN